MSLKLLPVSFTCILQQIVSTGRRVKTPAVMGSRAFIYFFLPSHPVVEFHHLTWQTSAASLEFSFWTTCFISLFVVFVSTGSQNIMVTSKTREAKTQQVLRGN